MSPIRLDWDGCEVIARHKGRKMRPGWAVFYALLATARGHMVTAAELERHVPWGHKKPGSTGKEVARHLSALESRGFRGLVAAGGRTRAWRWAGAPLLPQPLPRGVEAWLRSCLCPTAPTARELMALCDLARAQHQVLAARSSHVPLLRGTLGRLLPWLLGWRDLLQARLMRRTGDLEGLNAVRRRWSAPLPDCPEGLRSSVRARLAVVAAFAHLGSPADLEDALRQGEASASPLTDDGLQAWRWNARGCLLRRQGQYPRAAGLHARSVALSGIVGDVVTLSGALLNLALALPPEVPHMKAHVLATRWTVGEQWNVQHDSAWAPLEVAESALRDRQLLEAARWLERARVVVMELACDRQLERYHRIAEMLSEAQGFPEEAARHRRIQRRIRNAR